MFKIFSINKVLKPMPPLKENPRIFGEHFGCLGKWEDQIFFTHPEKMRVSGFVNNPSIEVGDYWRFLMDSGRYGIFEFTEVEYMSDPGDHFFGTIRFLKYEDE